MPKKGKIFSVENDYLHELNMKSLVRYHRHQIEQASIAEAQKEHFEKIHKYLVKRKDLRSGFTFIAGGPVLIDPQRNKRIFPHALICALRNVDLTHYPSQDYIKELQEILPNFRVSWWNYKLGFCRVIENDGMTEAMRKQFAPDHSEKRIFAESLAVCSERKAREADKKICEELLKTTSVYSQIDVMKKYLHSLPFSIFLKFRKENGLKTLLKAREYDLLKGDNQQERTVQAMWDEVRPHYPPSSTENPLLARMFAPNFSNVKSELRRTWFSDCLEFDFTNLHFACLAHLYPTIMKETNAWLSEGLSIWDLILNSMKIEKKTEAKPLIKTKTYSIEYGMDPLLAQKLLHQELKENNIAFQSNFLDCVYIQELAKATQQCLSDIETNKGMAGPFGWVDYFGQMSKESFMANVMQSFEVALKIPIYTLAINQRDNNHETFNIVHDQHDGLAILVSKGKEELAKKQILLIANKEINLLKINTKIMVKE